MTLKNYTILAVLAGCLLPGWTQAQTSEPLQYARITYTYDDTGRLTKAVYADPDAGDRAIAYTYTGTGAVTTRFAGPAEQVDTEEVEIVPDRFALAQNFPNPFETRTAIKYDVPRTAEVRIEVFDLIGRRVATLLDDVVQPGSHTIVWDVGRARSASGVYFCRLTSPDGTFTSKMIVTR